MDKIKLRREIRQLYNQYLLETRTGSFENWLMKKDYL